MIAGIHGSIQQPAYFSTIRVIDLHEHPISLGKIIAKHGSGVERIRVGRV